jgi:hypothetical protein
LEICAANDFSHSLRFYVNCGVYSSEYANALGKTPLPKPKEYDCPLRCRLERITKSEHPHFQIEEWDMQELTNVLLSGLKKADAYFLSIYYTAAMIDIIFTKSPLDCDLFRYLLLRGDTKKAKTFYENARRQFGGESRWDRINNNFKSAAVQTGRELGEAFFENGALPL